MRFKMERSDFLKSEEAKKNLAPSGRVVAV